MTFDQNQSIEQGIRSTEHIEQELIKQVCH